MIRAQACADGNHDRCTVSPSCECPHHSPRYPSTADLAAFRRSIGGTFAAISPPADTTRRYDDEARPLFADPLARPVPGAWADEREHGIGYRHPGDRSDRAPFDSERMDLRREATALRSRAFARRTTHPGRLGAFLYGERAVGCPDRATRHAFIR